MMMAAEESEQNTAAIWEALQDMGGYLARVEQGSEQILQAVHTGKEEEAIGLLMQVMEGFAYLLMLTDLAVRILNVQHDRIFVDEQTSVLSVIAEINQLNKDIVEAAENRDYSLLGDIVEYELTNLAGRAGKMVTVILQETGKG